MNSYDDIEWLATRKPADPGRDDDARERALRALLSHTSATEGRRRKRRSVRLRSLSIAAAAAAAVIAGVVAVSARRESEHLTISAGRPTLQHRVSGHAVLVRLAADVGTSASPAGDATLVQRTTTSNGRSATVFDLYGDNGTYYFSSNESGLPAQVDSGEDQGGGEFAREVAAAKLAATGSVQQAAEDMANAPDPSVNITPQTPSAEQGATGAPADGTLFDNYTWEDSQQALIAGSGDPQVRAGVLKILATLPGVTVTQGASAGQSTLVLSSGPQETETGVTEQLTVSAETGTPIQFVAGGSLATTTVSYSVSRVTLADLASELSTPGTPG